MASRSNSRPSPWWLLGPTPLIAATSSLLISHPFSIYEETICWSYGRGAEECTGQYPADPLTVVILTWIVAIGSAIVLPWITAPWLGFLSDRYGRTRVLTLSTTASLVGNLTVILAYWVASVAGKRVPYIFLLIIGGAVVQGAIGGLTIITAVTRAYLVDITTETNRASILSVHFGLNSMGTLIAIVLPSVIWRLHWPPMHAHYIFTGIHAAYALYVCHVVPDSLTNEEKNQAQESYKNSQDAETGLLKSMKRVALLCNPFATFGPTTINTSGNPLRHDHGKDWSLAFLALGLLLASIGTNKFESRFILSLYYRWGDRMATYAYVDCVSHIFAFLAFFPVLKTAGTPGPMVASALGTEKDKGLYSILRDLKIGRISIAIMLACYTILSLFPSSLPLAASPALAGVLGIVFQPALTSVIVSTYERQGSRHIGRLLGCLTPIEEFSFFFANYCIGNVSYPFFLVALYCLIRHVRVPEIHAGTQRHLEEGEEEEQLVNEE